MTDRSRRFVPAIAALFLLGCMTTHEPDATQIPVVPPPVVLGGSDSAGLGVVGSANALYTYRFRQIEPGGEFSYRDRDLSFYFRPTPTALFFRIENLQGRPVWIDWDQSKFVDVHGRLGKVAHSPTRWRERFGQQAQTQIPGTTQYSDYVFAMEDLVDPGSVQGAEEVQPHRPILPEDQSAPNFQGRTFGVDLEFLVEDRPRTYRFRYEVASVIPKSR
jgi:hypothetical protein